MKGGWVDDRRWMDVILTDVTEGNSPAHVCARGLAVMATRLVAPPPLLRYDNHE